MAAHANDTPPRSGRRWLWWIPAGCLVLLLLVAAGAAGLVWLIGAALGEAEAYQEPLRRAQASAEVRALLGEPVEAGWLPQGRIEFSNQDGGEARLSIPLHGPRGEAVLEKSQLLRDFTTRKHHAGKHRVELQVNGTRLAGADFLLKI